MDDVECPHAHTASVCDLTDGDADLKTGDPEFQKPLWPGRGRSPYPIIYFKLRWRKQPPFPRSSPMSEGWTHNHFMFLTSFQTETGKERLEVLLGNGGLLRFDQSAYDPNFYTVSFGSASAVVYDEADDLYIMLTEDYSLFVFDGSSGWIRAVKWPNGKEENYTYDGQDRLISVYDEYGRGVQYSYYSAPGEVYDGLLWRMGDHTVTGISTASPTGPYVEFYYVTEKLNGVEVTPRRAFLAGYRDVDGNIWTYEHYGELVGETDQNLVGNLTAQKSPAPNANELPILMWSYGYDDIDGNTLVVSMGDSAIQRTYDVGPESTEVTMCGKSMVHKFPSGLYRGTEDGLGNSTNKVIGPNYRPMVHTDKNGNETVMEWSADGRFLERITDAMGNMTQFEYDQNGRLAASIDPEGRLTEYVYAVTGLIDPYDLTIDQDRKPAAIKIYRDKSRTTLLHHQRYTYDAQKRLLNEENLDPTTGVVLQKVSRTYYTSGSGNGLLETITQHSIVVENGLSVENVAENVTTTFTYDAQGRVMKTRQSTAFGNCTRTFTLYNNAGRVLASVCNYESGASPDPTTVAEVRALYSASTPHLNRITLHEYDNLQRRVKTIINAQSTEEMATIFFYDGLNRVVRVIANYVEDVNIPDPSPVSTSHSAFGHNSDNTQNLVTDMFYDGCGRLAKRVDVLGRVTLYGYDEADRQVRIVQNASQPSYDYGSDPDLSGYVANSQPDEDIIVEYTYDKRGNVEAVRDMNRTVLNGQGQPEPISTFIVYDGLNRPVRNIVGADDLSLLRRGELGYDPYLDPRRHFADLSQPEDPDVNITTYVGYDSMGRMQRSWDPLGNVTLYGYDDLGRLAKTVLNASQPQYAFFGSYLDSYLANAEPDQDIIGTIVYDNNGRLIVAEDTLGIQTWQDYDGLGRSIMSIVNPVGTAMDESANDPRSDLYMPSTESDKDLFVFTRYNLDGHVEETEDVLGRITRYVYDEVGRVVKMVQNYTGGATNPADPAHPFNWEWSEAMRCWEDGSNGCIDHGENYDENIIVETTYDVVGRVASTRDVLGNMMVFSYDILGRQVEIIGNYVDGIFDIAEPDIDVKQTLSYDLAGRVIKTVDNAGKVTLFGYDDAGRQVKVIASASQPSYDIAADPDLSDYVPVIDSDRDIVGQTVYNKAGQVLRTIDARGTETAFEYDRVGRVRVVTQAVGTDLETQSYTCYNKRGDVLRTIQNWIDDNTSPDEGGATGTWLFNPSDHGVYGDQNLITNFKVDKVGRVVESTDPLGNSTKLFFAKDSRLLKAQDPAGIVSASYYDDVRRLIRTVQNVQGDAFERIMFTNYSEGIILMNSDGTGVEALAQNAPQVDNHLPAWSPDATKIVYTSNVSGQNELYMVDPDGSNLVRLTYHTKPSYFPVWSPDGSKIAYLNGNFDSSSIYVMNADGSNPVQVASGLKYEVYLFWHPNSQQLYFSKENTEIWSANLDGSGTAFFIEGSILIWRPDGSGYYVKRDIGYDIVYGFNLGQSEHINWGFHPGGDKVGAMSLSPDGRVLAYVVYPNTTPGFGQVYTFEVDSEDEVIYQNYASTMLGIRTVVDSPSWNPDGTKLAYFAEVRHPEREEILQRGIFVQPYDPVAEIASEPELVLSIPTGFVTQISWAPAELPAVDPNEWVWSVTNSRWEDGDGEPVEHGELNDQNIIVDLELDKVGRRIAMRDPRGNRTTYAYDSLNRRVSLINPLNHEWTTAYSHLASGGMRMVMTNPLLEQTQHDTDRLGRTAVVSYLNESPKVTPNVEFVYDGSGNRAAMLETIGGLAGSFRRTYYDYDEVNRLIGVEQDKDANGTTDETVTYEYDKGGLRTKMTMPGNLSIVYNYDEKGRLISMTDWSSQVATYTYDGVSRPNVVNRPGGLTSRYQFDPAGRLTELRHEQGTTLLGQFNYDYDARSNRTQAVETLAKPGVGSSSVMPYNDDSIIYKGTWSNAAPFKVSDSTSATLEVAFFGDEALLTMGTGPDHGIYDVYVGNILWRSFDGYAATAGERAINLQLASEGPHILKIRNRTAQHTNSTGNRLRFKRLEATGQVYSYDLRTNAYQYDALARLREADIFAGINTTGTPTATYAYDFDVAGNRTRKDDITFAYDAANRLTQSGPTGALSTHTYDDAGRMIQNRVPTGGGAFVHHNYTWDRAGRLYQTSRTDEDSQGGLVPDVNSVNTYVYNGSGQRIRQYPGQTLGTQFTDYTLDVAGGMPMVVATTQNGSTTRYVHGMAAQQTPAGTWQYQLRDALGSVRGVIDHTQTVQERRHYDPFGNVTDQAGTLTTEFGYTGEQTDASNDLVYMRARYYHPDLGVFLSLDPFEGVESRSMSLNGFGYVEGNPINLTDPTGNCPFGDLCGIGDAIRENPLETAAIGLGVAIAGLALTPAWPIAAAAGAGYLVGGVSGVAYAEAMYELASSGQCGCERKQLVESIGRTKFVSQAAAVGALTGGFAGGLVAAFPAAAFGLAALGIIANTYNIADIVSNKDIRDLNSCEQLDLLLSVIGLLGSAVGVAGSAPTFPGKPGGMPGSPGGGATAIPWAIPIPNVQVIVDTSTVAAVGSVVGIIPTATFFTPDGGNSSDDGSSSSEEANRRNEILDTVLRDELIRKTGFDPVNKNRRLMLDENLNQNHSLILRSKGFNIRNVTEIFGRRSLPDEEMYPVIESLDAYVVTSDRGRQVTGGFFHRAIHIDIRATSVDSIERAIIEFFRNNPHLRYHR